MGLTLAQPQHSLAIGSVGMIYCRVQQDAMEQLSEASRPNMFLSVLAKRVLPMYDHKYS